MGLTRAYIATSLDGYIAGDDHDMEWLSRFEATDFGYAQFFDGIERIVLGRRSFDMIADFSEDWPYGDKPAWVLSHRELDAGLPGHVQRFDGPVAELLTNLAVEDGDTWVVGGGLVLADALRAGVVDRLELFLMPVLLGGGVRLCPDLGEYPLRRTFCKQHPGGVTELHFEPR